MNPLNRSLIATGFYIQYLSIFFTVLTPHDRNWSSLYILAGFPTFSLHLCISLADTVFWILQSHFWSLTIPPTFFFYYFDRFPHSFSKHISYILVLGMTSFNFYPLQFILFSLNWFYFFSSTTTFPTLQ